MASSRREFLERASATLVGVAILTPENPKTSAQASTNEDVFDLIKARVSQETEGLTLFFDDIPLRSRQGERVYLGYFRVGELGPYEESWIEVAGIRSYESYSIRRGEMRQDTLWQRDVDTDEDTRLSPASNIRGLLTAPTIRQRIMDLVTTATLNDDLRSPV